MQNPYVTLGVDRLASRDQIREAYHARVKRCHPDGMQGDDAKEAAQESLVQLNLAYAEVMRQASFRKSHAVVVPDAKKTALRLLEHGRVDSALRILNKAADRDAEWFDIQGMILLRKGEAEAAHACFRTAVRLEPDNMDHRKLALDAGVQMRRQKTLKGRMGGWARNIVGRML